MTFVFLPKPIDLTIEKKYRVVFKAKNLVQKTRVGNNTSDGIKIEWPNDPDRSIRTDWGMIYGLGLGLSFVLDNTPDEGKTPGGTEPPYQPSGPPSGVPGIPSPPNVPGASGEPTYPLAPKPADYCARRKWEYEFSVPVWGYYYECFTWVRSGSGWAKKKISESYGDINTFGWYINPATGNQSFGHVQYPWPQAEF